MEFKFTKTPTTIQFTIPGRAVGKSSPRVMRNGGVTYPKKTKEWMSLVKLLARRASPPEPWLGPIQVDIQVVIKPGSRPYTKAKPTDEPTSKPDLDNIVKGIADPMSKVIYKDDSQITRLSVSKRFGDVDETTVTVHRLGMDPTQVGFSFDTRGVPR